MANNKDSSLGRGETAQTNSRDGNSSQKLTTPSSQGKAVIVPRFLVIRRIDEGNFDKVSPFVISKSLFGIVGNLKTIKKIKDGILVETVSDAQTKRLLRLEKLETFNVNVETHNSLNNSRGVIVCSDLLNCSTEEILNEMASEGVIDVRRIKKRKNGELVDTPNHILTFNRPKLPIKVKVAFYSLDVRPYIPNPLRCFNCQKFGHTTNSCKFQKICACGKTPHTGQPCEDPVKCVNCEGLHSAKSMKCPKMIEETNIQRVKVLENISYADARRKVCGPKMSSSMTFAQATSSNANNSIMQIMPNLSAMIESQIKSALNNYFNANQTNSTQQSVLMNPPSYIRKPVTLMKSGSVSDASQVTNEKRKRPEIDYLETESIASESDESCISSQTSDTSKHKKKKKGWPKGKSRNATTQECGNKTTAAQGVVLLRPLESTSGATHGVELSQPPD